MLYDIKSVIVIGFVSLYGYELGGWNDMELPLGNPQRKRIAHAICTLTDKPKPILAAAIKMQLESMTNFGPLLSDNQPQK